MIVKLIQVTLLSFFAVAPLLGASVPTETVVCWLTHPTETANELLIYELALKSNEEKFAVGIRSFLTNDFGKTKTAVTSFTAAENLRCEFQSTRRGVVVNCRDTKGTKSFFTLTEISETGFGANHQTSTRYIQRIRIGSELLKSKINNEEYSLVSNKLSAEKIEAISSPNGLVLIDWETLSVSDAQNSKATN